MVEHREKEFGMKPRHRRATGVRLVLLLFGSCFLVL
jgi:hypothetical protein